MGPKSEKEKTKPTIKKHPTYYKKITKTHPS